MPEKAQRTTPGTTPVPAHGAPKSTPAEPQFTLQPGPLSANAVVTLQRYVGNSGVQRLLETTLQRKKTIDEDVRINGNLSIGGHVISYDSVYGKQGLLTDQETVTKTLRSDGQAEVGGDLFVKGNTHKGSSIPDQ